MKIGLAFMERMRFGKVERERERNKAIKNKKLKIGVKLS